jgi:predicted enzyme related to lactoylglutathione lyase
VSIIVIGVTDLSKSLDFYHGTLGLEVTRQLNDIAEVSASSITLLLSETLGRAIKPETGSMEIVFPVESVSASYRLLSERGCKFIKEPAEFMPGSWAANFKDPDGHLLTVIGGK